MVRLNSQRAILFFLWKECVGTYEIFIYYMEYLAILQNQKVLFIGLKLAYHP